MKNITYTANLNKYGFPEDAPINNTEVPQGVIPWKLGIEQSIQARNVKTSVASVRSFQKQLSGNYAFATVSSGGTLFLSSTLTPNAPHALEPMYAQPYPGIYLGTNISANGQVYPIIGTANGTMFPVNAGLDFQTFDGTSPKWRATIINNSGAGATIGFNITWQYLWFNQGTAG